MSGYVTEREFTNTRRPRNGGKKQEVGREPTQELRGSCLHSRCGFAEIGGIREKEGDAAGIDISIRIALWLIPVNLMKTIGRNIVGPIYLVES